MEFLALSVGLIIGAFFEDKAADADAFLCLTLRFSGQSVLFQQLFEQADNGSGQKSTDYGADTDPDDLSKENETENNADA